MKTSSLTDILLAQKLKERDPDAITFFITHFRRSIHYTILKIIKNNEIAKDLTQEVLTKIINNIDQYSETYTFGGWVYRIAVNYAIDFLRKKKLKTVSLDQSLFEDDEKSPTLKDTIASPLVDLESGFSKTDYEKVEAILTELPDSYRNLLIMYYFKEMSYKEIADKMKLNIGTVKSQLHRAKKKFAELYFQKFQNKK